MCAGAARIGRNLCCVARGWRHHRSGVLTDRLRSFALDAPQRQSSREYREEAVGVGGEREPIRQCNQAQCEEVVEANGLLV